MEEEEEEEDEEKVQDLHIYGNIFKLRGGASMPTFVGRSVGLSVRL